MSRYVYTLNEDEPLTNCPQCGSSLTAHGGILLETTTGSMQSEWKTRLLSDGVLEDVDRLVENGQHSCTRCGHCYEMLINMDGVNEQGMEGGPERVEMAFDGQEAKGKVELVKGAYGADLVVNGVTVGCIDLCPCVKGGPPQIIIDGGPQGDIFAKVVITGDSTLVVVHKDAEEGETEFGIHSGNLDRIFVTEPTGGQPHHIIVPQGDQPCPTLPR